MAYHATYSARDVVLNYGGIILDGRADGDFLTISYNEDRVDIRTGMDGNRSIALNPDHSLTVTYTAFPESAAAKALNALDSSFRSAEAAGKGVSGILPLVISDKSGAAFITAPTTILTKTGDIGLGLNTGTQEFTFYCDTAIVVPLAEKVYNKVTEVAGKLGLKL